ncbi:hypothetical protein TNCV_3270241 [Trichonephila clavipes]|uniref:Uncharacterized protein n=1 Tax=Trichonephila clavipes TaxID=2585209 RepID=A0A8X6V539_TRICX|nr:hypothetical protein TNCV_3270241 [Trichonephila clavipes]
MRYQSARAPFGKRPQRSFSPNCEQPPNDFCATIMLMTEDNQSHYHESTMSEKVLLMVLPREPRVEKNWKKLCNRVVGDSNESSVLLIDIIMLKLNLNTQGVNRTANLFSKTLSIIVWVMDNIERKLFPTRKSFLCFTFS